ncbi:MAG: ABC transporter ATP-binding protein [bacterium]|nr:ABC transporter ATP-binding protein [bacterium]
MNALREHGTKSRTELDTVRLGNLALLRRMLGFAKPYLAAIALSVALTLTFSAGRYARAYLMKPLLDDVLLPAHAAVADAEGISWSPTGVDLFGGSQRIDPAGLDPARAHPNESAGRVRSVAEDLRFVVVAALAIAIIMPAVMYARLYLLARTLGRVSIDIKNVLAAKLLRLPLSFHRTKHSGETLNRALNDATTSENALKLVFGDFLQAAAMVIGGAVTLVVISWQLTLISLLSAPFVIGTVAWFARRIRKTARRRQEQLGEVTQRLVDILAGIKVIKAFGGEGLEEQAFQREATKLFQRDMKVVKNRILSRSLVEFVTGVTGIGMLGLGAWFVMRGMWGITPGAVAAFATVLATTYRPVKTLSRGWSKLSEALASAERFYSILDMETETPDRKDAAAIDGVHDSIRFADVSFHYDREPVIDGVNLEVRAGEVIAVVGRSGEGKSTLVDLLMRFYDPSSGSIEVDGRDLRAITRKSLMAQVAIVSQEPFLFDTTIAENIRYGRPDARDDEVRQAAAVAHVDEFVTQLPEGYETQVGEFGLRLSGGQRQRITIARALLKNPAILVFDEATSALDAKTEQTVQDAIDSLRGSRTLFIVAHRLSTIRRADRIVVMQKGRIAQQGTHEELMAQPGLYRDLAGLQSDETGH